MMDPHGWVTSTGKKPQGSLSRAAWRWKGQGSKRGESRIQSPLIPPVIICFPSVPSFLDSDQSCPLSSPLLYDPKSTRGFRVKNKAIFSAVVPFFNYSCLVLKRGLVGGRDEAKGHKTLNHRHEAHTPRGQALFDHPLALSANKRLGRFIWSVPEHANEIVSALQRQRKIII